MKSKSVTILRPLAYIVLFSLLATYWLAAQDERQQSTEAGYTVRNLGSLGGTGCCFVISNNDIGWVDGTSNLPGDKNFHPFLWRAGRMQDLGTLGGPNSSVGSMNDLGVVTVGGADTAIPDPLGEDWCGFGTHLICRSYIWYKGNRTLVPTVGGNNGDVSGITNSGLVLGFAETAAHDSTCMAPQVLGFEAFLWNPDTNGIQVLPPLPGDTVTAAFHVNEHGDVSGASGICGGGLVLTSALHAVIWKNGLPIDLGSLGGSYGNLANSINNQGQVVGQSDLAGDATFHGFLWSEGDGLKDLGTLPGDVLSLANGINDRAQIAMQSCDANFNCRAAIWKDGVMTDLNTVVAGESPLFLLFATSINSGGQIVGAAFDPDSGSIVPFLATPCGQGRGENQQCQSATQGTFGKSRVRPVTLPETVREQLRAGLGLHFRTSKAQFSNIDLLNEHSPISLNSPANANSCLALGAACTSSTQCCNDVCGPYVHRCCLPFHNMYCTASSQCCSGTCLNNRCL